ncbi:MAG: DedA family protein [Patescibacteria group bacterium]|nr:DedA family protein [Patescibacteria group bacterium]MCL5224225.1 DedA family protein [Patescibacteria group bacterium]
MLYPTSPIISWLLAYRYPIAYPIAFIEGPMVMMISGFLVRIGFFAFLPIYLVLIAGDLTGDVVWYWVGRHGARKLVEKYGRFLSITEAGMEKAETFFRKHQGKIIFISKITMGFGFSLATILAAGAAKVPFKKYFLISLGGEFIWCGFLMGVGFFLGNLYTTVIGKDLKIAFIAAIAVIMGLVVYGAGRFINKRFFNGV